MARARSGSTDNGTNVYFHNDLEFTSGAFTGITGGILVPLMHLQWILRPLTP